MQCNVIIEEDVKKMFTLIEGKFGRLDILFNNAGGATSFGTKLDEVSLDGLNKMMEVNCTSAWLVMK